MENTKERIADGEIVIDIGFNKGNTIKKNVCIGLHPSIIAASSISIGIDLTNPLNINTESPDPNPRYIIIIPRGLSKFNILAILLIVNITIWNGTIIENTNK